MAAFQLSNKFDLNSGAELGLLRSPAGALVTPSNWSAMQSTNVWTPPGVDLWQHQVEATKFAMARERGALLAMDMGTGKLLTSLLIAMNRRARVILVTATKRAIDEWTLQLEQWWTWTNKTVLSYPNLTVAKEVERFRREMTEAWKRQDTIFVLINYQRVWRPPFMAFARNVQWDLIIADEVHKIKAPGGKASKALYTIGKSAGYRLGLTGTPMPHEHTDLYATARFVDDSVYGTRYQDFLEEFAVMGGYESRQVVGIRNLKGFAERFWSFVYRVDDSVQDLPRVRNVTVPVLLGDKSMRVYRKLEKDYTVMLKKDMSKHEVSVENTLTCMLRLMQITSGFVPNEDGDLLRLGWDKREALEELLDSVDPEETVIVFANFHPDLDAIAEAAKRTGRKYGEISGRQSDYLDWRRGKKSFGVIGVQTQAGAESINLTKSNIGVFFSLPLSLDLFKQARKRLHRPGQKRKVKFAYLIAKGTWDVKTRRSLLRREDVLQGVLQDVKRRELL